MRHFRIAKAKEKNKYFYSLVLPSKNIVFIYFCIDNINIVLCEFSYFQCDTYGTY